MSNRIKCRLWGLYWLIGITFWSCSGKKVVVLKTPSAKIVYKDQENRLLVGFPKYAKPWIVFSTKEKGAIYPNKKCEASDQNSYFFEPLVVLKRKGDRYKVAKYKGGSVVDYKIDKGFANTKEWIKERDLLLWTESLRDATTGFRVKGVLTIQDAFVISNSEQFIKNDSIYLYKDPSFQHKMEEKIAINSLVYLYKFSEDQKKVLIGGEPKIDMELLDRKSFGWIDARLLTIWGERTAFRIKPTPGVKALELGLEKQEMLTSTFTPVISSSDLQEINDLTHIYPITYSKNLDDLKISYFDHLLDYSDNEVYNVEGQPISYQKYKSIVANNQRLNIVFILDGSKEVMDQVSTLKAVIQRLEEQIALLAYFTHVSYSTLFYNVDPINKQKYNKQRIDFNSWSKSFDYSFDFEVAGITKTRLYDSMEDLSNLLSMHENQSNLVVLLGQNMLKQDSDTQKELINQLINTHSRLILYQVKANYNATFSDFVLFGQEVIKTLSDQLVKYKKQRLIQYEDVVAESEFDLSQGNQGVYRLDYPLHSMHQGAVVFPQKGAENKPFLLQNAMEKMLRDIVVENKKVDSTLTTYFRSIQGVYRTKIKAIYSPMYKQNELYVSPFIAQQLIDIKGVAMYQGVLKKQQEQCENVVEYGVLLDEEELEELQEYYASVYSNVFKDNNLTNRRMIRRYVAVAREKSLLHKKMTKQFLYENSMPIGLFQSTGLYIYPTDSLSRLKLDRWKQKKVMKTKMLEHFFANFKTKANEINEHKGDKEVLIQQNQRNFYWLTTAYLPILDYNSIQKEELTSDILPMAIEKIQVLDQKKKGEEDEVTKYIERVKRGMP